MRIIRSRGGRVNLIAGTLVAFDFMRVDIRGQLEELGLAAGGDR